MTSSFNHMDTTLQHCHVRYGFQSLWSACVDGKLFVPLLSGVRWLEWVFFNKNRKYKEKRGCCRTDISDRRWRNSFWIPKDYTHLTRTVSPGGVATNIDHFAAWGLYAFLMPLKPTLIPRHPLPLCLFHLFPVLQKTNCGQRERRSEGLWLHPPTKPVVRFKK